MCWLDQELVCKLIVKRDRSGNMPHILKSHAQMDMRFDVRDMRLLIETYDALNPSPVSNIFWQPAAVCFAKELDCKNLLKFLS